MSKRAPAEHPIHDLIARRWSPVVFSDVPPRPKDVRTLLEAARWAASCFNEQPWAYVVGVKGDDGEPNRHAWYDAGQAAANLSIQATAMGLHVHQMGGFSPEKARARFALPDTHEPIACMAVGHIGDASLASPALAARDAAPRARRGIDEFVFGATWGAFPNALRD